MEDNNNWLLKISLFLDDRELEDEQEMRQKRKKKLNYHIAMLRTIVKDQETRIKELSEKIAEQKQYILRVEERLQKYKEEFDEKKKHVDLEIATLKDVQQDVSELRVTTRKQNKNLSETLEDLSDKFDQFLIEYATFKNTVDLRDSPWYGEHLWIIRNYTRRLRRIRSGKLDDPIRSEPFYTGLPGYRLCVWVYLNGRGHYLGDSISVYGKVMAGDYDSIMQWPIRPQFTFILYEQNRGDLHRSDIVRRRKVHEIKRDNNEKDKTGNGIPRPLGDDRSIIVGFDNFVSHEELHTRGFLKNDNIFLKVEVEIKV